MKALVSKSFTIILALCLLGLGLVGLLVPVLPGVLFLVLGLLLLGRVSGRINRWLAQQEWKRKLDRRLEQVQLLHWMDRLRVSGWMMLQAMVRSLEVMTRSLGRLFSGR